MARLIIFFLTHPATRLHVRELMRCTGLPSASAQAELRRLTAIGALTRSDEQGRTFYAADEEHPSWRAWVMLLRATAAPGDVIREALAGFTGIEAAFLFGSTAQGTASAESDVDLFLVAGTDVRGAAERVLAELPVLIGREVDVIAYDADELGARLESGNAFVEGLLAGPKIWVCGDPESLPGMVPA
ncbi:nucleotidyltransferase domain-containing protein [Longimicrobium sp.]|uniref:nucleotidyltransferase domain-containing protein n=1 Tax=Longimicrobium sp. TaxID=2029185 RepID=UPI002EDAABF5